MKKKLQYEHVDRKNLAVYLGQREILSAEANDGTHVYRCLAGREETLVIALPDGNAVIISCESQAALDRRRLAR